MADIEFRTDMDFAYGEAREIIPGVVRIVANNPGPFTYKGTNTYIVGDANGSGSVAVIDPGPDDEEHCEAILRAVKGRAISHIILTHTHHDHIDGLGRLQAATAAKVGGYGRQAQAPGRRVAADGTEVSDQEFLPELVLRDDDRVAGEGWTLRAIHTPGHAPDHLCFALEGVREGTQLLFSGDHVMAWNTSVVAPPEGRMGDYLRSLERLIGRGDTLYLPGHGGRLERPGRMVRAYLIHRRMREDAIVDALKAGTDTIPSIVALIYPHLDESLVGAAALSVQAHLEHLIERGVVSCAGMIDDDARFAVASSNA